jgi:hypothetical protein
MYNVFLYLFFINIGLTILNSFEKAQIMTRHQEVQVLRKRNVFLQTLYLKQSLINEQILIYESIQF